MEREGSLEVKNPVKLGNEADEQTNKQAETK